MAAIREALISRLYPLYTSRNKIASKQHVISRVWKKSLTAHCYYPNNVSLSNNSKMSFSHILNDACFFQNAKNTCWNHIPNNVCFSHSSNKACLSHSPNNVVSVKIQIMPVSVTMSTMYVSVTMPTMSVSVTIQRMSVSVTAPNNVCYSHNPKNVWFSHNPNNDSATIQTMPVSVTTRTMYGSRCLATTQNWSPVKQSRIMNSWCGYEKSWTAPIRIFCCWPTS